jgi:hypothetical protein
MKKLSAAEAIGPAWEHTKLVMCVPFRWQRFLKLGFVALVAQMAASGFSMPVNIASITQRALMLAGIGTGSGIGSIAGGFTAIGMLLAAAVLGLVFLIAMALFYIASRMQFVLFDVVATRQTAIGATWKKYGAKTWRWIGLKLLLGLGCIVVIGTLLFATLPFLISAIMHLSHANDTDNVVGEVGAGLVLAILALILGTFFFAVVLSIILSLLHDFALPFIALEDLRLGAALLRLEHFVKESPGEVTLYLLLKFALCIALGFVGELLLFLAMLVSAVPFAVVGVPLYFLLHGHGTGATILLALAALVGGLAMFAWLFVLCAAIFGYVHVFLQSYALYFMGGRYQLLGNLLEPPVAPPTEPTPVIT